MDFQAVKPVSSVASAPSGKGRATATPANSGKDLPPPPAPPRIDPTVIQAQSRKKAAVAQQMSRYLQSNSRELEFHVDSESGQAFITVRDASGNVVRTIPHEAALAMLRRVIVDPGTFVDSLA
jgi:hypothetical protein